MTKKDYEAAARLLQDWRASSESHGECQAIENAFVCFFSDDSPRFDIARFRAACVPGANVKARATRTDTYRHEAGEDVPR